MSKYEIPFLTACIRAFGHRFSMTRQAAFRYLHEHKALEKTIKAYWCGTRDDDPPYIHDHNRLLELCGLAEKMSDEQQDFIDMMKPMYIAARYPEHKQRVAATLNEQTCKDIVEQTKQFRQWILQEYSAATKPSSSSDATSK